MAARYATQPELEILYPNVVATDGTRVDAILELAECFVHLDLYDVKLSQAHILFSAHVLWLHPNAGPSGTGSVAATIGTGAVASAEDGGAKMAWHPTTSTSGASDSAYLGQTPPGLLLIELNGIFQPQTFAFLARAPVNASRLKY